MSADGPVLRDIHLPPAAWWPPAPGWWLLATLVLLLTVLVIWLVKRRARRGPLRAAMREVDRLECDYSRDGDTTALAAGASRLLRRVALRVDPACAAAPGDAWRAFLRTHAGDANAEQHLDALVSAPFQNQPPLDARALLDAVCACCRHALRRARPPRGSRRLPASGGERVSAAIDGRAA